MREEIREIVEDIVPGIDWEDEDLDLNECFDSMDIIALIAELETHYGIEIDMTKRVSDNFVSLDALCSMVEALL